MVRSSRFDYLSPATFLDDLVIKGRVSKWGTSSFELACGRHGGGRGWVRP